MKDCYYAHADCYVDHHFVVWSDSITRCYYCGAPPLEKSPQKKLAYGENTD